MAMATMISGRVNPPCLLKGDGNNIENGCARPVPIAFHQWRRPTSLLLKSGHLVPSVFLRTILRSIRSLEKVADGLGRIIKGGHPETDCHVDFLSLVTEIVLVYLRAYSLRNDTGIGK